MIAPPPGTRVYLACGLTDMRRGFDGLAAQMQMVLRRDPHDDALFVFRCKRSDLVKAIWWDGQCGPASKKGPLILMVYPAGCGGIGCG